jgi:hypothetical protein
MRNTRDLLMPFYESSLLGDGRREERTPEHNANDEFLVVS